jgi:hypothetical protein
MGGLGRRMSCVAGLVLLLAFAMPAGVAQSSLPVVPGAAGFGMQTRAAYACGSAPTVYRVTNLNDSGAGSLREGLAASGPRVVIFETSGYITLNSPIYVKNPCVTVAGQTAPSPGITVRAAPGISSTSHRGLYIATHDVLLQHFRIRPGGDSCNSGIQTYDPAYAPNRYNIVIDHMSISWAQDEGMAFEGATRDSTLWRSIVSETLYNTSGTSGCTGGGISDGHGVAVGNGRQLSMLQNLLAHNLNRNFLSGAVGSYYVANNVVYDPGAAPHWIDYSFVSGSGTSTNSANMQGTAVGNHFRRSLANPSTTVRLGTRYLVSGAKLYLNENMLDGSGMEFVVIGGDGIDPRVSTPPISLPGYGAMSSSAAYTAVLANAGARPADRDSVDTRVVSEVQSRSGRWITHEREVGGYPSLSVNRRALTLPAEPHAIQASGYTNLEMWLHDFSSAVETDTPPSPGPEPPSNVRISTN